MPAIVIAFIIAFILIASPAFARTATKAQLPTRQQCEDGWKPGMQWTKTRFEKECAKIIVTPKPGTLRK